MEFKDFKRKRALLSAFNIAAIVMFAGAFTIIVRQKPLWAYSVFSGFTVQAFWLIVIGYFFYLVIRLQQSLDNEYRERKEEEEVKLVTKGGKRK